MLDNINVTVEDLKKLVPDVESLQYEETATLDDVINEAKRTVYSMIKENYLANYKVYEINRIYPEYGTRNEVDTTLEKVKDYTNEQYIKQRIIRVALAYIFRQNKLYEEAEIWSQEANTIPLKYYVDADNSGTPEIDEEVEARRFGTFHR